MGAFCDRVHKRSLAKNAYIVPTEFKELCKYVICQEPALSPWTPCEFKGSGEDLDLPEFDDEHLERGVDIVCAATNGFSFDLRFEAAYLAVHLYYNKKNLLQR